MKRPPEKKLQPEKPAYVTRTFNSQEEDWGRLISFMLDDSDDTVVAMDIGGIFITGGDCSPHTEWWFSRELARVYGGDPDILLKTWLKLRPQTFLGNDRIAYSETAKMTERANSKDIYDFQFSQYKPYLGFRIAEELSSMGWSVILQSNISNRIFSDLSKKYKLDKVSANKVLSYEIKELKPGEKFYQNLDGFRNGARGWYIDDRLENLEAAATRGWKTILFE